MKVVNSPLQRTSSVPRVVGEATNFVDASGMVQLGMKVAMAETRLWERKTATSAMRPAMAQIELEAVRTVYAIFVGGGEIRGC